MGLAGAAGSRAPANRSSQANQRSSRWLSDGRLVMDDWGVSHAIRADGHIPAKVPLPMWPSLMPEPNRRVARRSAKSPVVWHSLAAFVGCSGAPMLSCGAFVGCAQFALLCGRAVSRQLL